MRGNLLLIAALLPLLPAARGQSFEVATIKLNPNCSSAGPRPSVSPGRLNLPCSTLRSLIRIAYGTFHGNELNARPVDITGGPAWLDSERYALSAKAEGAPAGAVMMGPMLQKLLEERFQLKLHTEAKETSVYALTVVKPGKVTPAKEGSCLPVDLNSSKLPDPTLRYCGGQSMKVTNGIAVSEIFGTTMDEFAARMLTPRVGRPVVDKTGLTGRFDLRLEFSPEALPPNALLNGVPAPDMPAPSDRGPSIFTALQEQLGLKLTADRAAIPVIVVDSAAKPVEN